MMMAGEESNVEQSKSREWSALIEFEGENHGLKNINAALYAYNDAYKEGKHSDKELFVIVNLCEDYIEQNIPIERRRSKIEVIDWSKELAEWPHVLQVLELQKQAVKRTFYPPAENDRDARWELLRELVLDEHSFPEKESDIRSGGKMLDKNHWKEFSIKGKLSVARWIAGSDYENRYSLRSFYEVVREEEESVGNYKKDVLYLEEKDLEQFKVEIKGGLLYFRGYPLNTSNAKSVIHELRGEVIFVATRSGDIYVSDPYEDLGISFRHSSFTGGKRVLCSGTMEVNRLGEVIKITLASGHYQPAGKHLLPFLRLLKGQNVDLSNTTIIDQFGMRRLAEHVIENHGYTLPYIKKDQMFYLLAQEALKARRLTEEETKKTRLMAEAREHLEQAAELGNLQARHEKARYQVFGDMGYEKSEKKNGLKTLMELYVSSPNLRHDISLVLKEIRKEPPTIALPSGESIAQKDYPNEYHELWKSGITLIEKIIALFQPLCGPRKQWFPTFYWSVSNQQWASKAIKEIGSLDDPSDNNIRETLGNLRIKLMSELEGIGEYSKKRLQSQEFATRLDFAFVMLNENFHEKDSSYVTSKESKHL